MTLIQHPHNHITILDPTQHPSSPTPHPQVLVTQPVVLLGGGGGAALAAGGVTLHRCLRCRQRCGEREGVEGGSQLGLTARRAGAHARVTRQAGKPVKHRLPSW